MADDSSVPRPNGRGAHANDEEDELFPSRVGEDATEEDDLQQDSSRGDIVDAVIHDWAAQMVRSKIFWRVWSYAFARETKRGKAWPLFDLFLTVHLALLPPPESG